jgi:hypothetical protein
MAKGNKSSGTTRLPEELKAELRKEQAPYLSRGLEAPSFGALLIVAWKAYKGLPEDWPASLTGKPERRRKAG